MSTACDMRLANANRTSRTRTAATGPTKATILNSTSTALPCINSRVYRLTTEPSFVELRAQSVTVLPVESDMHYFATKHSMKDKKPLNDIALTFFFSESQDCNHFREYYRCLRKEEGQAHKPNLSGRLSLCASNLKRAMNAIRKASELTTVKAATD